MAQRQDQNAPKKRKFDDFSDKIQKELDTIKVLLEKEKQDRKREDENEEKKQRISYETVEKEIKSLKEEILAPMAAWIHKAKERIPVIEKLVDEQSNTIQALNVKLKASEETIKSQQEEINSLRLYFQQMYTISTPQPPAQNQASIQISTPYNPAMWPK